MLDMSDVTVLRGQDGGTQKGPSRISPRRRRARCHPARPPGPSERPRTRSAPAAPARAEGAPDVVRRDHMAPASGLVAVADEQHREGLLVEAGEVAERRRLRLPAHFEIADISLASS